MKYHINGGPYIGGGLTLIHLDEGDDPIGFVRDLITEVYARSPSIGGPVLAARQLYQPPMREQEADSLVEYRLGDRRMFYVVSVDVHRQRRLGLMLTEVTCSCESGEAVFALDESMYQRVQGVSSEEMLRALHGRPWAKRIEMTERAERLRAHPELN